VSERRKRRARMTASMRSRRRSSQMRRQQLEVEEDEDLVTSLDLAASLRCTRPMTSTDSSLGLVHKESKADKESIFIEKI